MTSKLEMQDLRELRRLLSNRLLKLDQVRLLTI